MSEAETSRAVEDRELQVVILVASDRKRSWISSSTSAVRASARSILLISTIGRFSALDRLLQDEAGLRKRTLRSVHEQQHALDHRQDALDLRAEVAVARRVDDVDDGVAVVDRRVLGEDRDPALLLELARVHDELVDVLADAERAALLQERVDERRLAVVDVRHDGEPAPVGADAGSGDGRSFHGFGHILV